MDPNILRFLLLLFVINLGFQLVRRFREGLMADLPYNLLLGADAALCIYALSSPGRITSIWSWLGIGIFIGAVLIPGLLSLFTQLAMGKARWGLAHNLLSIKQMFAPSVEVRRQIENLARLKKAHAGNVDEIERDLQGEMSRTADPAGKRLLQETLLELLAFSGQWERCLNLHERMVQEGMTRLSRPTLAVALIRASLESRDPDRIWAFYRELQKFDPTDPVVISALLSAEIMLLAAYGYSDPLEHALFPVHRGHPVFPVGSKRYWLGLAHLQAGSRAKAESYLLFPSSLARENPILDRLARDLSGRGTEKLAEPTSDLRQELDHLAQQVPVRFAQVRGPRPPIATGLFLACMALAFMAQSILGGTDDLWSLYQLGANFRTLSVFQEPWRLVTAMFLHAGVLHLLLNGLMMFMFGRILEVHFGFLRTFAVFVFSGIAGNIASALVYRQGLSVGASSTVFGMIGAVLMMFIIAKDLWHPVWRKKQIQNLVFLLLLNLLLGFSMSMIDNAAHIGGFIGGIFFGWFFLVFGSAGVFRTWVVRGLGLVACALVIASVLQVGRNFGKARLSPVSWLQAGHSISMRAPVFWQTGVESLQNPLCGLTPTVSVIHAELAAEKRSEAEIVDLFLSQYQVQGKRDGLTLVARRTRPDHIEVEYSFSFQDTPGTERLFIRVEDSMLWVLRFVYDLRCGPSVLPFVEGVAGSFRTQKLTR